MITRKTLLLALLAAVGMLAWNAISAQETVMLQVSGTRDDYYARLWVVEAKPYFWIRAETPRRRWLEQLRDHPNVFLWRGDQRQGFHAVIWEDRTGDAHAYVDALFRQKYGLVDQARALLRNEPTVLIRLEPHSGH
jgi:hypothetical protein